ncbi:MAG: cob(I)yrinic acid a,c-diamide adenosyltransferase [Actinomycetota bacterium]
MIQVYTGDGKGKTTTAMGLAVRAAGRGFKVAFIQFLKESAGGGGDAATLANLSLPIEASRFGEDMLEPADEDKKNRIAARVAEGLDAAREKLKTGVDVLVLDEISHAINLGLCRQSEVVELIESVPEKVELVLTGRDMPEEIVELAGLVTEMRNIRHPYDDGVAARYGIEY